MMDLDSFQEQVEFNTVREKIESEIAPASWVDLQRAFAQGIVLFVLPELNLVDVAEAVAENNTAAVESWTENQKITIVSDDQAREWFESEASLLTVIVQPWVLIQTIP
jgi:hypothetical protein